MNKVNCAYRVHASSEILFGMFDVEEGIVVDCPNLVKMNLNGIYEYMPGNYNYYRVPAREDLALWLIHESGALAVIDFNCIGALIVFPTRVTRVLFEDGSPKTAWDISNCCKMRTSVIGVRKTSLVTKRVTQMVANLCISYTDEYPQGVIYSSEGTLVLDSDIKPGIFKENYFPMWLDFVLNPETFAFIFDMEGKPIWQIGRAHV